MAFINPLDFDQIFVNELAGSVPIFGILAFIVIGILAARFRMPNLVFLILIGVFVVFTFFALPFAQGFMIMIVTSVIILFAVGISRLMNR